MVELPETPAGMVEHTVEHNLDIAEMRLIEQLSQRRIPAQQRINLKVIKSVVAVVRCAGENRVQIERRYTEVAQIVQLIDHAQQITALKALFFGMATPLLEFQPRRMVDPRAAGKAIWK